MAKVIKANETQKLKGLPTVLGLDPNGKLAQCTLSDLLTAILTPPIYSGDLNSLTTAGIYNIGIANQNGPGAAGTLFVIDRGSYITQYIITLGPGTFYMRVWQKGTDTLPNWTKC